MEGSRDPTELPVERIGSTVAQPEGKQRASCGEDEQEQERAAAGPMAVASLTALAIDLSHVILRDAHHMWSRYRNSCGLR